MDGNDKLKSAKKIGKYILTDVLGKGQCATVYQGIHTETNQVFAVKMQSKRLTQENEKYKNLFSCEIRIMHTINHPNVLHLHELLESVNNFYLITDFCNQGDFHNYLRNRKLTRLPEKEAIHFLKQIMNGFRELRNHEIMHRDLKMENLLVNDDTVKIADFGMAKMGYAIANTVVGSFLTMAPELYLGEPNLISYTSKADLWSIGFIYYQMLFGEYPFYGLTPSEIGNDIRAKSGNLKFPSAISAPSRDLLNRLLQMNPENRIDWPDFFAHSLFVFTFPKSLRDFAKKEALKENLDQSSLEVDLEFTRNKQELKQLPVSTPKSPPPPPLPPATPKSRDRSLPRDGGSSLRPRSSTPGDTCAVGRGPNITEEVPNERELSKIQHGQNCTEVGKRYNHEKNKIAFLVYVVKFIRKLAKSPTFAPLSGTLTIMAILLMKKAITLNDLNLMSLNDGNNIFEQPGFPDLLKSSFLETVKNYFRSTQTNFDAYLAHLYDSVAKAELPAEDRALLEEVRRDKCRLGDLDDRISGYYNRIQKFEVPETDELRHDFVLLLVSVFYAVHCEIYFPYKINNVKFQWNEFYDLHESMSDEQLLKIIE